MLSVGMLKGTVIIRKKRLLTWLKNRTNIWPKNLTVRHISKEMKLPCGRDLFTPMFIAVLFTVAKMWKCPKCPLTKNVA